MAYNCGTYCSTVPRPGCQSTVPGTSAPTPPALPPITDEDIGALVGFIILGVIILACVCVGACVCVCACANARLRAGNLNSATTFPIRSHHPHMSPPCPSRCKSKSTASPRSFRPSRWRSPCPSRCTASPSRCTASPSRCTASPSPGPMASRSHDHIPKKDVA